MSHLISYHDTSLANILKWEKDISTQEWCEENVNLPTDAGPIPGMVRFDDTPHIEEVLKDFDKNHVWKQLLNWSTQTGKTFSMQCAWAKSMDTDPARVQWAIKNKNDVGDYLEEKIYPFLRGVDSLQKKIVVLSEEKKKKLKAASINIPGGGTTFTGTTQAELRSKSAKYIFADEIALYDKGNFIELEGRTKAFERHFRKVMAVSSRKHKNDEMDVNYKTCETIKEWQTYCKECEEHFYAGSKHLKFLTKKEFMLENEQTEETYKVQQHVKQALKNVYIQCPNPGCKHQINNTEKDKQIHDRKYKFTIVEGDEDGATIGYKANALAVRITSLEIIASLLINAEYEGDNDVLDQFYIDYFNEFYERDIVKTNEEDLLLLGNGLKEWVVPKDTFKIYMGVDTQTDHFWYEVKAYCYGNVSHSISSGRVESFSNLEDIWEQGQNLIDEDGNSQMISKVGIDRMGDRTYEVDTFVEYMVAKWKNGDENRIYATMGRAKLAGTAPYLFKNTKDMSTNRNKVDIKVIVMDTTYLKNKIALHIERTIANRKAETKEDKGFDYKTQLFLVNQDTINADMESTNSVSYTRQINAESYDYHKSPTTGKLDKEKSWGNPHQRDNHLFDTSVICEEFAEIDKIHGQKKIESSGIAKSLGSLSSLNS